MVTVILCDFLSGLDIRWTIENPYTSRIWLTDPINKLVQHGAQFVRVDFCAYNVYNMPWKKSTHLLASQFHSILNLRAVCNSHQGICQYSCKRHIILSGRDHTGLWMTRRAQPYPFGLCHANANCLVEEH
jgi:hypothetical protein